MIFMGFMEINKLSTSCILVKRGDHMLVFFSNVSSGEMIMLQLITPHPWAHRQLNILQLVIGRKEEEKDM